MRPSCLLLIAVLTAGCSAGDSNSFPGYVEGEYVRVAAPVGGRLDKLLVQRGAAVESGAALFELERAREQAAVSQAGETIAAVRAQAEQAQAQWKLAVAHDQRMRELRAKDAVSQEQVDAARTELQRSDARRRELGAQLASAEAQLEQVRWQLDQKGAVAPAAGLVEDTYYRVGEWVPAGAPVVSLLPPQNRLVRFFVPETELAAVHIGQQVQVHRDGNPAPIAAQISYIAPRAEFTPPVIYSRETRSKLVFLVEARPTPADATDLHPGQPVDVAPAP